MVALLTGSGHRERDTTRMPRANAGHLAQTLVGLARQLARVPARGDALVAAALGHADRVDHLVLGEDLVDGHLLLEVVASELHLVGDAATVQLDLHDVRLLLTLLQQLHLNNDDETKRKCIRRNVKNKVSCRVVSSVLRCGIRRKAANNGLSSTLFFRNSD